MMYSTIGPDESEEQPEEILGADTGPHFDLKRDDIIILDDDGEPD